ncbi:MAG TPA: ankyrin repeat domain-containing protein, partial [Methylomirabilota bacterium]|nr:ankyrin repeat domain-containing protein [Methylomirabilota bacterium]
MKLFIVFLMALAFVANAPAADALTEKLQRGLFEEEANHNLDAAIKSYESVIQQGDEQRKVIATAIFRLGECYRKLGRTNEASAQYQRLLRDFSEQEQLVKLSRDILGNTESFAQKVANIQAAAATDEEEKEVRRIQAMIKDSPDLINARDNNGYTPLHRAATAGQIVVAKFLLANKADVNAKRFPAQVGASTGETPLHFAAGAGHKSMVELLLDNGADVNAAANGAPLHRAVGQGYRAVAEILLEHHADVNAKNIGAETPLHLAVNKGFKALAELLFEKGADVN